MNIKLSGSELNRMMKVILQCTDTKTQGKLSNVCVTYGDNALTIRASNGQFAAEMSTPLLGGDGESFCVDGSMFAKVCGLWRREIGISTTEKDCVIRGAGRTRLPVVNVKIPAIDPVSGSSCTVKAEAFADAYNGIAHAVSSDQARIQLTGVHMKSFPKCMTLTALDGFQLAREEIESDGEPMDILIPGGFVKLIVNSTSAGETVRIITDGKRIQAETEGMTLTASLLANSFPPVERMIPENSKTEVLIPVGPFTDALKASAVINNLNRTVRLNIGQGKMKITNNCEQADYEAELDCEVCGDAIAIAFNQQYILNAINSIDADEVMIRFSTTVSPVVFTGKTAAGFRVLTPVRTGVGQ